MQYSKKKKQKNIQMGKEETKPSLLADDVIVYIGTSKESTKKTRTIK